MSRIKRINYFVIKSTVKRASTDMLSERRDTDSSYKGKVYWNPESTVMSWNLEEKNHLNIGN